MRIREFASYACMLLLLALSAGRLAAQDPIPVEPPRELPADTLPPADTIPPEPAELTVQRSPRGAFVRSLVLPGWGQAWVGAPGRGGVYFAMEAGSLWMLHKSVRKLREARREEAWLIETGQLPEGERSGLVLARQEQREDWLVVALFLLLFSGADAFVAAHLADFDEHVGVLPTADGGLRLQLTLPVGARR